MDQDEPREPDYPEEEPALDEAALDEPWRHRFALLRLAASGGRGRAGERRRRRRAWYRLDPAESSRTGQLILELFQQDADRHGQWGPFRPLAVERAAPESFSEAADRELVHLLGATAPALTAQLRLSGRHHRISDTPSTSFLPPLLHASVLPRLAATGRFFWSREAPSGEADAARRIVWDPRSPWTFAVRIVRDPQRSEAILTGCLRRGAETMPVAEAEAVVDGAALVGDTLAPLESGGLATWIWEFRDEGDLRVSEAQLDAMLDELWNLPDLPPVEMPPEWRLGAARIPPRPRLVVRAPRSPHAPRLQAILYFDYGGRRVAAHDRRTRLVDRPAGRVVERDDEAEESAFDRLLELGAEAPRQRRVDHHFEIAPERLSRVVLAAIDEGWLVEADGRRLRRPERVRFSVVSGIDWFELRGTAEFEGASLLLPELLAAIRREERLVRLDDGTCGLLPEDWLERYTPLARWAAENEAGGDGEAPRFLPGEALLLDALLAPEDEVESDRRFARVREQARAFERLEPCREPPGFAGELRPYQREGLAWLRFLEGFGFGGCLADDMGLGKTVQVLALLEARRREERERRPSLVVVPRSLVHNWIHEAERFTPGLAVLAYGGAGRGVWRDRLGEHDLVVTTYGTLRSDVDTLAEVAFDYVVLDEAQAIKNVASQSAKACRRLAARHRLALTGTPVENHLGELWSIFAFLNPGLLGRVPVLERLAARPRLDEASLELLGRALRPFILRRTKQAVLDDLPAKTEQVLYCDLAEPQRKLYDELRVHYRSRLGKRLEEAGLERSKFELVEALLRLRQTACHPGLVDEARVRERSAKLNVILDRLDEILAEGHKALVFSQFTSFLAILRRHLDRRGIVYEYLDGATRNRRERVERFQGDEACRLFLISLKAGGVGLNLTAADYVFLLDPWWNPAVEAQAVDRAHRIGQERPVFAFRLISRGTVEEKILRLQETKRDLADAVLTADQSVLRALTADELRWLLS